jgi:tetratricopeptide (TPR) repeat protein
MSAIRAAMLNRISFFAAQWAGVLVAIAGLAGCSPQVDPDEKARFDQFQQARKEESVALDAFLAVSKNYYIPSATASGVVRAQLLAKAETGYVEFIAQFSARTNLAAQALRNLGNVLGEQGRIREAVSAYDRVAIDYPTAEWEILQTMKAAGDVLWNHSRTNDAIPYYQKLIGRYESRTNEAEVIGLVLKGARSRLKEAGAAER